MTAAPQWVTTSSQRRRFHVRQRLTLVSNRYVVRLDDNGLPGELLGVAQQKAFALREQITFYRDEARTSPVFTISADRPWDFRSVLTVSDSRTRAVIGRLAKIGGRSLVRSTWEVRQAGMPTVTVTERRASVAVLRRVSGPILSFVPYADLVPLPWVFHFDGATEDGTEVLTHTRLWGVRSRYVLEVVDDRLQEHLAVALAVCLDAMQGR